MCLSPLLDLSAVNLHVGGAAALFVSNVPLFAPSEVRDWQDVQAMGEDDYLFIVRNTLSELLSAPISA